jgi:hypothetical protein
VREFVAMVVPIVCMAQYSKSSQVSYAAAWSATCLAYVDPETAIPPLLETVFPALETLTETHQTCSALQVLGCIARPLVWRAHYPEGVTQLSRLLYAALPGIDINDSSKTASTLRFFTEVFQCVTIIDSTSVCTLPDSASVADRAAWQLTGLLGDWILLLFDKLFVIFSEQSPSPDDKGAGLDSTVHTMTKGLMKVIFNAASDQIYESLVRKLLSFVRSTTLPGAVSIVGQTIAAACFVRPDFALR